MSVTIHWRPVRDKGKSFERGTSTQLDALKKVFGTVIRESDIEKLRAMSAAASHGENIYDEIADVVEGIGDIEFWGEY